MDHHPLRQRVIERFAKSWSLARPENATVVLDCLTDLYDRFRAEGLADAIFEEQLTCGNDYRYTQRVGELLLADMLWRDGFTLESRDVGPDFRATKEGKTAWVELHTPEPTLIPADYFPVRGGSEARREPHVYTVPHTAISLRLTAAIAEKKRKLLGYLADEVVKAHEPYIIAVNSRLLNPMAMTGLHGISGKPAAVEVLFGVGPVQYQIDSESGQIVDQYHQHRPSIVKPGTPNPVPADTFLDEKNSCVSAVLAIDLLEQVFVRSEHPSALVYNPLATNPIPTHWLSAQEHWACTIAPGSYTVTLI
ncbi:hypothetical protein CBI55_23695 [Pseudomonas syringae]|uniref:hypothetical protein n=1 Tax=Pseudomonas syringae TaxID=317 RepID=UPI000C1C89C9|nr:hypothetical protein [Pseudomonas syringae]PIO91632.1 hypothetical protein CBI55_23695 [Pseudomonas syringae]POP80332.1 hypothetical protein CXB38_18365 [Pseudomonas syringae]